MRSLIVGAVATVACTTASLGDFTLGQPITINGSAGGGNGENTTWGTWADQGAHPIGGESIYVDSFYGEPYEVKVTSTLVDQGPLSILFDFSEFAPGDYPVHGIDILNLKQDGSILGATASQGFIGSDGNSVFWLGAGEDLEANPFLKITIYQVPAPGAISLLALAGFSARRRRA